MNLYEIGQAYEYLMEQAEQFMEDGNKEALDKLQNDLVSITEQRDDKIGNYAKLIKNLTAESEAVEQEEKNLKARRINLNKKIDWLKGTLSIILNGQKWRDNNSVVSFRKSEKVEISPNKIPDTTTPFTKVECSWRLSEIKEAIKAGEKLDWAEIKENQNIQIK